jgi:N-acetylglucosaminyldiphosphoundecaprenol N-acetyl-beta-D-mannosaminyltransferase
MMGETSAAGFQTFDVIGTRVSAVSMRSLTEALLSWQGDERSHCVCFADANSVLQARDNHEMRAALDAADVVSPDGMPLAMVGKLRGAPVTKTSGPDFLEAFCSATAGTGTRHFFVGGMPGVATSLAAKLSWRFPGLSVVGTYAPPRFPLTPAQNDEMIAAVAAARPDVVWVGLGAPKQEIWMHQNRDRLAGITLLGVGAAFDFSAGTVKRAPLWMRNAGLEWAYRTIQEPRRLFGRYARTVPRFIGIAVLDFLRSRARGS